MPYTLDNGWIVQARAVPSPNFGPRPRGIEPSLLVIHNISLPPGQYEGNCVERFFTNCLDWAEHDYFSQIEGLEVSAHVLLRRDGEMVQFVSLDERAWHAGDSCFQGRDNCNDFSIGIELEGTDIDPYTDVQYQALQKLTALILSEYSDVEPSAIVGHSDIAPGRKTDPGDSFDWRRYRADLASSGFEV